MNTMDILKASLEARGYSSRALLLGVSQKSFTQFRSEGSPRLLTLSTDSPLYPFSSSSARLIANFKNLAYDLASSVGVPIPDSVTIALDDNKFEAADALLFACGLVVVKPNSSSVSNGLTLGIDSVKQLHDAITFARGFSDEVLVQRQVTGDEIRFAVIDGNVRAAILRQTPGVDGDGISTLAELIVKENELRRAIVDTAVVYPAIDSILVNLESFDVSTIPAMGERVELGKGTMIRLGASIYDVMDTVDPSYIAIAKKLAGQLGHGFVVVDMMIHDYTQSADPKNYVFIEYNLTPALQLFYSCRDGNHFDVAGKYLAPMIDKLLQRSEHD